MANLDFIANRNISEDNCFLELMQTMDTNFENEISLVEHSPYYNNNDFRNTVDRVSGSLRILNLNCGGLNAKFDKLKIFLAECNNNFRPISVIALQETHLTNDSDINSFQLPDYNFVYDLARINTFGGVAFYVHKSFSFERLPTNEFNQTSPVYESMLLLLLLLFASIGAFVQSRFLGSKKLNSLIDSTGLSHKFTVDKVLG